MASTLLQRQREWKLWRLQHLRVNAYLIIRLFSQVQRTELREKQHRKRYFPGFLPPKRISECVQPIRVQDLQSLVPFSMNLKTVPMKRLPHMNDWCVILPSVNNGNVVFGIGFSWDCLLSCPMVSSSPSEALSPLVGPRLIPSFSDFLVSRTWRF